MTSGAARGSTGRCQLLNRNRSLESIDDEHVGVHATTLEFEAQLLLYRRERGKVVRGRCVVRPAQVDDSPVSLNLTRNAWSMSATNH